MTSKKESRSKAQHMAGTCMGMCPNAEVRLRQREKLVHPLEMAVGADGKRLNYPQPRAMVKAFSRPAAGQLIKPSDIRPVPVLMKTLKYLLTNVCCRKDLPWAVVYQFVSDRLQAIRQDLCVQGVRNVAALQIYQGAVRFYTYAQYRTCEHQCKDFDPFLNKKQLAETLGLVMTMYKELDSGSGVHELRRGSLGHFNTCNSGNEEIDDEDSESEDENEGRGEEDSDEAKIVRDSKASEKEASSEEQLSPGTSSVQAESQSDKGTLNNGGGVAGGGDGNEPSQLNTLKGRSKGSVAGRDERRKSGGGSTVPSCCPQEEAMALYLLVHFGNEEALTHVLQLPHVTQCWRLVALTVKMNIAWLTNNFYRVLKLSSLLPPLHQCALHSHLTVIQRKALGILTQAHSCKGVPYNLEELSAILLYNSNEELAETCRHYGLTVKDRGVLFTKGKFNWEAPIMNPSHKKWIEDLLATVPLPQLLLPSP